MCLWREQCYDKPKADVDITQKGLAVPIPWQETTKKNLAQGFRIDVHDFQAPRIKTWLLFATPKPVPRTKQPTPKGRETGAKPEPSKPNRNRSDPNPEGPRPPARGMRSRSLCSSSSLASEMEKGKPCTEALKVPSGCGQKIGAPQNGASPGKWNQRLESTIWCILPLD